MENALCVKTRLAGLGLPEGHTLGGARKYWLIVKEETKANTIQFPPVLQALESSHAAT